MKPVKASLHTPTGVLHNPQDCFIRRQACFIIRRIASYADRCASWHAVPLHTPSGVLHKPPCQTWHGAARRAKTAEAFAFANMTQHPSSFHDATASHFIPIWSTPHSAFAPYDEKIKNESLLPENALILIKSPQLLRDRRLAVNKKSLQSSS